MDVKAFQTDDAREDGPRGLKQFLLFANYYTKDKDPVNCPTSTDCTANATLWQYNYVTRQFTLRQNIDHVAYCTSVDVREHNSLLFLVATSSVAVDYISVYRWIEGSFRIDEVNGWLYGWNNDQVFGWVPASFSDFVQDLPTSSASDCQLYHAGEHFCLAVSNYAIGKSTQAPVDIYKWNDAGCRDTQLGGCFELLTHLPAIGAKSVMSFSSHPAVGEATHFVVVANSFEGSVEVEVPSHSIKNSYVYMINYQTGEYELIQAIQTASAQAVRVFEHCGFPACRTFLAVSNMKGFGGLVQRSKLYKLSDRRNEDLTNTTCAMSQIEQFEEVLDVPTVGGVELFYVENKNDMMPYIFSVLSNGGVGLQIFNLDQVVSKPRPVIDYSGMYGPCDALLLDASASMNSGGRDFIVRWNLLEYDPSDTRKSVCRSALCAPPCILKVIQDAVLYNKIDMPIIPDGSGFGVMFDPDYFPAGNYVLVLELTNWMGGSQSEKLYITKQGSPVPLVKIEGEIESEAYASQEMTFLGTAQASRCKRAIQTGLTFQWTIDPVLDAFKEAWGSKKRSLLVPANTLDTDTTYTVTLWVYQGAISSKASVQVKSMASQPVAKLSGGDRMVSLAKDAIIQDFVLDAHSSFSPDKLTNLRYVWACGSYDKVGDADLGATRGLNCEDFGLLGADTKTLTISAHNLREQIKDFSNSKKTGKDTYTQGCPEDDETIRCDPTSKFYFSVTVCNPGSAPCQKDKPMTSTATVSWSTTPRDPGLTASIAPLADFRVSPVFDVAILGTSNVRSGVSYRWVQMDADYDLLQAASVLTSVVSSTLVVKAGVLVGAQTFTFRLYASVQGSLEDMSRVQLHNCEACSWAQMKMLSNLAPSSGQFDVTPAMGTALQTTYTFSAREWVDPPIPQEDYPLSYTFGYKDVDGAVKYLAVDSLYSSHQSDLPLGNIMCAPEKGNGCRELELVLEVADALGARGVALNYRARG